MPVNDRPVTDNVVEIIIPEPIDITSLRHAEATLVLAPPKELTVIDAKPISWTEKVGAKVKDLYADGQGAVIAIVCVWVGMAIGVLTWIGFAITNMLGLLGAWWAVHSAGVIGTVACILILLYLITRGKGPQYVDLKKCPRGRTGPGSVRVRIR